MGNDYIIQSTLGHMMDLCFVPVVGIVGSRFQFFQYHLFFGLTQRNDHFVYTLLLAARQDVLVLLAGLAQ